MHEHTKIMLQITITVIVIAIFLSVVFGIKI